MSNAEDICIVLIDFASWFEPSALFVDRIHSRSIDREVEEDQ